MLNSKREQIITFDKIGSTLAYVFALEITSSNLRNGSRASRMINIKIAISLVHNVLDFELNRKQLQGFDFRLGKGGEPYEMAAAFTDWVLVANYTEVQMKTLVLWVCKLSHHTVVPLHLVSTGIGWARYVVVSNKAIPTPYRYERKGASLLSKKPCLWSSHFTRFPCCNRSHYFIVSSKNWILGANLHYLPSIDILLNLV